MVSSIESNQLGPGQSRAEAGTSTNAVTFERDPGRSLQSVLPIHLCQSDRSFTLPPRRFAWLLRVLCGCALCVTGYLAFTALRSKDVAGCGGGQIWDCGHVLNSRWSTIFGLPVSVPAFALYAISLGALSACLAPGSNSRLRLVWGTITIGAVSAGLAAVWFLGLQVFEIGHACVYCLVVHACGLGLCGAILWKRPLGMRATALLSIVGVVGVSGLVAGQVLVTPPAIAPRIEHHPDVFVEPHDADAGETSRTANLDSPVSDEETEIIRPF